MPIASNPAHFAAARREMRKSVRESKVQSMAATKTERASVGFGVGRQGASTLIEVRPHHDIIPAIKGVQISFELLNGITDLQARKILEVLNENVVGLLVTSAADEKKAGAAG